ncbi:MAG: hypothetical protein ACRDTA_07355 [Pseudonocardiaceae bacterium]
MIDIAGVSDSQREHSEVVGGEGSDDEHPAWCSAEYCYVTDDGVRVHEQAPTRWEDDTAEVRCESRLVDPADDADVYVELELQSLRFAANQFHGVVPVAAVRRLRDQLSAHLDAER